MQRVDERIAGLDLRDALLQSERIGAVPGVRHGITSRVAGLGLADGNIGYSAPRDRADAWMMRQRWSRAAGLNAFALTSVYQVHGNAVYRASHHDAGRGADPDSTQPTHADALICDTPGVVLMTVHADCMPILLCDPVRRAVASIHAGWRSTVLDIAGETVRAMGREFGSDPADLLAFLAPAIGVCCYEVGDDVADAWRERAGAGAGLALVEYGERWRFDLEVANRYLLAESGVRRDRIEAAGICTKCNGDRWFSHRGQGATTGRYAAMIGLVEDE